LLAEGHLLTSSIHAFHLIDTREKAINNLSFVYNLNVTSTQRKMTDQSNNRKALLTEAETGATVDACESMSKRQGKIKYRE